MVVLYLIVGVLFFHHVLNGMCAYRQSSSCVHARGLSSIEVARRIFSIVFCASSSILTIACQSLGYFLDFDHQSRSPFDVLGEYERRLISFEFRPVLECLLGISCSSFEDLLILTGTHGLSAMGGSNKWRENLVDHTKANVVLMSLSLYLLGVRWSAQNCFTIGMFTIFISFSSCECFVEP